MRRRLTVALALFLALSLPACGQGSGGGDERSCDEIFSELQGARDLLHTRVIADGLHPSAQDQAEENALSDEVDRLYAEWVGAGCG